MHRDSSSRNEFFKGLKTVNKGTESRFAEPESFCRLYHKYFGDDSLRNELKVHKDQSSKCIESKPNDEKRPKIGPKVDQF